MAVERGIFYHYVRKSLLRHHGVCLSILGILRRTITLHTHPLWVDIFFSVLFMIIRLILVYMYMVNLTCKQNREKYFTAGWK